MPSAASTAAWHVFLAKVEEAQTALHCPPGSREEAWFRGQSDSAYTLTPSLYRPPFLRPDPEERWQLEQDLYWDFSSRARELHTRPYDSWDTLFAMQHHRTPTRLLDWTEILGVALYFATLSADTKPDVDPCVWVMNPYALNRATVHPNCDLLAPRFAGRWPEKLNDPAIDYEDTLLAQGGFARKIPVALYVRRTISRLHAQRGTFTLHGDSVAAIESHPARATFVIPVILPHVAIPAAKQFLHHAGIDHFSLFPDLQNLSQSLIDRYGRPTPDPQ